MKELPKETGTELNSHEEGKIFRAEYSFVNEGGDRVRDSVWIKAPGIPTEDEVRRLLRDLYELDSSEEGGSLRIDRDKIRELPESETQNLVARLERTRLLHLIREVDQK